MANNKAKTERRNRIRFGIRSKIKGTAQRPRLSVFRSNREIYAQLIDDVNSHTLVSASSHEKDFETIKAPKKDISKRVGLEIAKRAKAAGIETVIFDRGGYLYHGRVQALADGAREGGLKF